MIVWNSGTLCRTPGWVEVTDSRLGMCGYTVLRKLLFAAPTPQDKRGGWVVEVGWGGVWGGVSGWEGGEEEEREGN